MFIYPIFLQTNLCRHWSQKGSKGRFPGPDKLQNATNQGKEKEKRARKKNGGEEKKMQLLRSLEIFLAEKRYLDTKGPFGGNVFEKSG